MLLFYPLANGYVTGRNVRKCSHVFLLRHLSRRVADLLVVVVFLPEAVSPVVEAFNHFKVLCITMGLCNANCYNCESIINYIRQVKYHA
jgi:hypothetical protein